MNQQMYRITHSFIFVWYTWCAYTIIKQYMDQARCGVGVAVLTFILCITVLGMSFSPLSTSAVIMVADLHKIPKWMLTCTNEILFVWVESGCVVPIPGTSRFCCYSRTFFGHKIRPVYIYLNILYAKWIGYYQYDECSIQNKSLLECIFAAFSAFAFIPILCSFCD